MIRISRVIQTCERNPSQWEGSTEDGDYLYVRYRWGCLSIGMGKTKEEAVRNSNIMHEQLGASRDGDLKYAKLREVTKELIEWPELPGPTG